MFNGFYKAFNKKRRKKVRPNGLKPLTNMDHHQSQLILGLKEGNNKVFKEIFDLYYEPLCRFCLLRMGKPEDAEEIIQDIFVKLWVRRNELDINQSLKSYLYRTAANRVINYFEHQKVRLAYQNELLAVDNTSVKQPDELTETEIEQIAAKAVSLMPAKMRQVYELSRHDGLKYKEIAQELGISVKTVEAHLSRALDHMRKHLKDYLPAILAISASLNNWFA